MRAEALLLCFAALAAIFLIVGCTGGSSQANQAHAPQNGVNVKLALLPEHDSGVSGTASFEDISGRIVIKLDLRGLPKPNTFYLAHIHPSICDEGEGHEHGGSHVEEEYGHDHGASGHEHGAEIEYPLSQMKSDSEDQGSRGLDPGQRIHQSFGCCPYSLECVEEEFCELRLAGVLRNSANSRSNIYERAGLGSAALKGSLRPSALRVSGRGCSVDNDESRRQYKGEERRQ